MITNLGSFLKNIRLQNKFSLRDIEKKTGVSNSYLSQIENGIRRVPTLKILKKLSIAYEIAIYSLISKALQDLD